MKLSKELVNVFDQEKETVSLREILSKIDYKSFGLILTILALPSSLPVPATGYSTPFGIALFVLGAQIFLGREYPWLPEFILNKKVSSGKGKGLLDKMIKFLQFFEKFIRPRHEKYFEKRWLQILIGSVVLVCSASMISPIPLTDTVPAMGIFLIGLGMIEEDFWAVVLGLLVAFVGIFVSLTIHYLLITGGMMAIDHLKESIFSLI